MVSPNITEIIAYLQGGCPEVGVCCHGVSNGKPTRNTQARIFGEVAKHVDSYILRTKKLCANTSYGRSIHGHTKRVDHTAAKHISIAECNRLDHIVPTCTVRGQKVFTEVIGNRLLIMPYQVTSEYAVIGA